MMIIKLFGYLLILILTRGVHVKGEVVLFLQSFCKQFWNFFLLRKIFKYVNRALNSILDSDLEQYHELAGCCRILCKGK